MSPMFNYFKQVARHFINNEDGPTAVEYAVMLALIILACIGSVLVAGGSVADTWADISTDVDQALN